MTLLQALETDDPSEDYSRRVRNRMTAKESADYIARIAEELLSWRNTNFIYLDKAQHLQSYIHP